MLPNRPLAEDVRAAAWTLLVERHLLSRVDVDVTLGASSHNSAYARLVDGLLHNESRLDAVDVWAVTVTGSDVAAAFLDACDGARAVPRVSERASLLTAGLAGLVGRRVEVRFDGAGEDAQSGRLLAVTGDALVLGEDCNDGELLVVPRAGVRAVYTYQLTAAEDAAIFPGDNAASGATDTTPQPAGEARDDHDEHDDTPSAEELDAALGSVWQSWCEYRASADPVAAAFALGAFANEFYHYTTDRLGFGATTDATNGAPTGGLG